LEVLHGKPYHLSFELCAVRTHYSEGPSSRRKPKPSSEAAGHTSRHRLDQQIGRSCKSSPRGFEKRARLKRIRIRRSQI